MTYKTNLEQERRMLFCLNQIQQLGAVSICSLGEYFGSYSSLFNIEETALRESGILRETQIQAFCEGKKRRSEYLEEYEKLAERKIRFITPLDPEYPERLLHIHGYPMALYVRGKLPDPKRPGGGSGRSPRMLGIWEPAGICICGDACKGEGTDHQRSRPWD